MITRIYIVACITASVMFDKGHDHLLAFFAGFLWAFGLPGFLLCICINQGTNYALMGGISFIFWLIVGHAGKASRQGGSPRGGLVRETGYVVVPPYRRIWIWWRR